MNIIGIFLLLKYRYLCSFEYPQIHQGLILFSFLIYHAEKDRKQVSFLLRGGKQKKQCRKTTSGINIYTLYSE